MTHRFRLCAAGVALALVAGVQGCRDTQSVVRPASAPAPRSITPRVVVAQDDAGFAVITVALDLGADVGRLGSFTGRLHFDSLALAYAGEVTLTDGTARASNREGGVVRVAGMSANGIDATHLASFRFKVLNAGKVGALQFDLEEIHELSRANVAAFVRKPDPDRTP